MFEHYLKVMPSILHITNQFTHQQEYFSACEKNCRKVSLLLPS